MTYVYRFGLGRWVLPCVLFIAGVMFAIQRYPDGFDPKTLPSTAAGMSLPQSEDAFPCKNMVYSISQDDVHAVRENGGGTVFAARLNRQVGFYRLNPYRFVVRANQAALDIETAGRLSKALLQCVSPWLPAGTWFSLRAKAEPISDMNAASG
jgi:hypothetical protein